MNLLPGSMRLTVFAAFALFAACALAASDAQVRPEPYFSHADFDEAQISPSGRQLAALAPVNGRRALIAMDLASRKPRVVTTIDGHDICGLDWVNDRRLVFSVCDFQSGLGDQRGGGLFAIDVDGADFRTLAPTVKGLRDRGQMIYRYTLLARAIHDGSDDVLVLSNDRSERYPDMYRLDTRGGRRTLLSHDSPGDAISWVADRKGIVRAAVTMEKGGLTTRSWWRRAADAKWQLIGEYSIRDASIVPVAFDGDGSLVVGSDIGRETVALYRYDTAKMALGELLAAHPRADLARVIYDRTQSKIVGVHHDGGRPGIAWFDDGWARLAATVDRALPDRLNEILRGEANHMLIHSVSDTDPGSWYLLDMESRKLEFLASERKAIRPSEMPRREPVRYKARDGLEIPAILTLPKGREAKDLPLVLYVHGGPYVRGTHWTWSAEAAYLAALGYAVLEPDFRGSTGWGRKFFQAGWKQWGLAMQDDLVDGIDWLAAKGTIDPKRVCIMGASYGGYAVMMGLARDPDRFRCGVNYVGVTDIGMMFSVGWSDFADSDYLRYAAKELIGDPDKDAERFRATSPLANASRIRTPVLMVYGGEDYRVPVVHGERMRDALAGRKDLVEWVLYPEEGHGFLLESNRYDFYTRVANFLAKHLR